MGRTPASHVLDSSQLVSWPLQRDGCLRFIIWLHAWPKQRMSVSSLESKSYCDSPAARRRPDPKSVALFHLVFEFTLGAQSENTAAANRMVPSCANSIMHFLHKNRRQRELLEQESDGSVKSGKARCGKLQTEVAANIVWIWEQQSVWNSPAGAGYGWWQRNFVGPEKHDNGSIMSEFAPVMA